MVKLKRLMKTQLWGSAWMSTDLCRKNDSQGKCICDMYTFHRLHFSPWKQLLIQWGSEGRIPGDGTAYGTTADKFGQKGEISNPWDKNHFITGLSKIHNQTRALKGQECMFMCQTSTYTHTSTGIVPPGSWVTPILPQSPCGTRTRHTCHLELGGGFVKRVLKLSGTCFVRAADHLAWHTVYQ